MDAYILGTHEGDLPTHILGAAGSGRVRAMAELEGAPHTIFVAVQGDNPEAIEDAVTAVRSSGLNPNIVLPLDPAADDVSTVIINLIHIPAHMPPWLRLIFLYIEAEIGMEAFAAAIEALGPEGVAVASNGKGGVLVELGGNDIEAVEAAAAALAQAHDGAVIGRVAAGGVAYA